MQPGQPPPAGAAAVLPHPPAWPLTGALGASAPASITYNMVDLVEFATSEIKLVTDGFIVDPGLRMPNGDALTSLTAGSLRDHLRLISVGLPDDDRVDAYLAAFEPAGAFSLGQRRSVLILMISLIEMQLRVEPTRERPTPLPLPDQYPRHLFRERRAPGASFSFGVTTPAPPSPYLLSTAASTASTAGARGPLIAAAADLATLGLPASVAAPAYGWEQHIAGEMAAMRRQLSMASSPQLHDRDDDSSAESVAKRPRNSSQTARFSSAMGSGAVGPDGTLNLAAARLHLRLDRLPSAFHLRLAKKEIGFPLQLPLKYSRMEKPTTGADRLLGSSDLGTSDPACAARLDLGAWLRGWTMFEGSYIELFGDCWSPSLRAYRQRMLAIAGRYPQVPDAAARVDFAYRQQMGSAMISAGMALPDWTIDHELVLDTLGAGSSCCVVCGSSRHQDVDCDGSGHRAAHGAAPQRDAARSTAAAAAAAARVEDPHDPGNRCWSYNLTAGDTCKFKGKCSRSHACAVCGGKHPAFECTKPGGGPGWTPPSN